MVIKKTIKNITGKLEEIDSGYTFTYPKDGKLVIISSDNTEKIEDFIIN